MTGRLRKRRVAVMSLYFHVMAAIWLSTTSSSFPNAFAFLAPAAMSLHTVPPAPSFWHTTPIYNKQPAIANNIQKSQERIKHRIQHMSSLAAFYDLSHVESSIMDPSSPAALHWATGSNGFIDALTLTQDQAETLAGPLFGASLFPYLVFLYFLSRSQVDCPKGVTVGFATCLLFVFLTIPAAIAAKILYGVSLADADWLHGAAESLLTLTNLVTVVAFRQALAWKEQQLQSRSEKLSPITPPTSTSSYQPMIVWVIVGTLIAAATAAIPALASDTSVHTPYLGGFLDLPPVLARTLGGGRAQPDNALSVPCWIIHVSSLVEFLVAMGFCWRWADVTGRTQWKGITWGLLPLHSSGITACTYHLFYNQIAALVPLQAALTFIGNTTAAYAAYRLAVACEWNWSGNLPEEWQFWQAQVEQEKEATNPPGNVKKDATGTKDATAALVGFEDLRQALADDNDYTFLFKLFAGCAIASYVIKYGEVWFDFPFEANVLTGLSFILVPSLLNAYKWSQRSKDPSFEGWF